jgi:hypothetical protein
MNLQEQSKKLDALYAEAIEKLTLLGKERELLIKEKHLIIKGYIRELEQQKIEAIRNSLSNKKK